MRPAQDKPPGTETHHEYSRENGYEQKEYEHQEYPKQVGETLVHSAEEEKALSAKPAKPRFTLKDVE